MSTSTNRLSAQPPKTRAQRLAELPAHQRALVEVILPVGEISYWNLRENVLSGNNATDVPNFDRALNELVVQGYLSSFIEDGQVHYLLEANLTPDKRDEQSLHNARRKDLLETLNDLDDLEFDDPFA